MNTQKVDAPFSEFVIPYFKTHSNDVHLNIHCGPEGIEKAELDANDYRNYGYCPSLCLPKSDEFTNYWWPVKDLKIVLNWSYEDSNLQIQFSNYLANVCQAHQVFTLLSGDILKFQHERRLAA